MHWSAWCKALQVFVGAFEYRGGGVSCIGLTRLLLYPLRFFRFTPARAPQPHFDRWRRVVLLQRGPLGVGPGRSSLGPLALRCVSPPRLGCNLCRRLAAKRRRRSAGRGTAGVDSGGARAVRRKDTAEPEPEPGRGAPPRREPALARRRVLHRGPSYGRAARTSRRGRRPLRRARLLPLTKHVFSRVMAHSARFSTWCVLERALSSLGGGGGGGGAGCCIRGV